jgi:hypothetical protein
MLLSTDDLAIDVDGVGGKGVNGDTGSCSIGSGVNGELLNCLSASLDQLVD